MARKPIKTAEEIIFHFYSCMYNEGLHELEKDLLEMLVYKLDPNTSPDSIISDEHATDSIFAIHRAVDLIADIREHFHAKES